MCWTTDREYSIHSMRWLRPTVNRMVLDESNLHLSLFVALNYIRIWTT